MKYVHTNIITQDWQRLADFYIKTFNCVLVPPVRNQSGEWLDKGTGVKHATLHGVHLLLPGYGAGGPTLEIYSYEQIDHRPPVNPNSTGIGHLAFEVDDVETIVHRLKQNGGSTCGEISSRQIEGVGKITFIYTRDPDGNIIEIQHWDR